MQKQYNLLSDLFSKLTFVWFSSNSNLDHDLHMAEHPSTVKQSVAKNESPVRTSKKRAVRSMQSKPVPDLSPFRNLCFSKNTSSEDLSQAPASTLSNFARLLHPSCLAAMRHTLPLNEQRLPHTRRKEGNSKSLQVTNIFYWYQNYRWT